MESRKNILDILGFLSLVAIVYHNFQVFKSKTETTVISDSAYKAIQNPKTANQVRDAVDNYHDTGKWNKKQLEAIQ